MKHVATSLDELLRDASLREPMTKPGDSLSGSQFDRVVIDGDRYVLKHLHVDDDWIMRATGDMTCMPVRVWSSGLVDRVADHFDDAIAGCATGLGRNGWGAAILLRDVGTYLVPEGSDHVPWEQQRTFFEHMAQLHAAFWDFTDDVVLLPMTHRYQVLTPSTNASERAMRDKLDPVPAALPDGWKRFLRTAPHAAPIIEPLLTDQRALTDAMERVPQTLVHSDFKLGNLGTAPDGRTILIDWAWPGRAPACVDLTWYLGVNCDRLPVSKEEAIDTYRTALEGAGIDTTPWWDEALALASLGSLLQLGWSKEGDELAWWDEQAQAWAKYLA